MVLVDACIDEVHRYVHGLREFSDGGWGAGPTQMIGWVSGIEEDGNGEDTLRRLGESRDRISWLD